MSHDVRMLLITYFFIYTIVYISLDGIVLIFDVVDTTMKILDCYSNNFSVLLNYINCNCCSLCIIFFFYYEIIVENNS